MRKVVFVIVLRSSVNREMRMQFQKIDARDKLANIDALLLQRLYFKRVFKLSSSLVTFISILSFSSNREFRFQIRSLQILLSFFPAFSHPQRIK